MRVVLHADVEHAPAGAVPFAVVDAVGLHVGVATLAFCAGREAFAVYLLRGLGGIVGIGMIDEDIALFGKTSQENSMLYKPIRKISVTIMDEVKKEIHEKK